MHTKYSIFQVVAIFVQWRLRNIRIEQRLLSDTYIGLCSSCQSQMRIRHEFGKRNDFFRLQIPNGNLSWIIKSLTFRVTKTCFNQYAQKNVGFWAFKTNLLLNSVRRFCWKIHSSQNVFVWRSFKTRWNIPQNWICPNITVIIFLINFVQTRKFIWDWSLFKLLNYIFKLLKLKLIMILCLLWCIVFKALFFLLFKTLVMCTGW